ncbi:hypothetical protein DOTSEDRAFT_69440 [Dothistroma septosporum NZE10]|uniref:Zn(2)-C6 fungal-type domain-containing protein n=1 Tax=Dothistroma septosporum (strain NZE10 / CBS 128990) TaxID=675120 RepID=N1PWY8_DOTSN|nr:hypothetical protein DOTSEDRAFT_69440 [Dothistroma septosporum NZE10]
MPNLPPDRPKKLQRISQACDLCHRRSIRCRPSAENPQHQCQNCYDFAVDCTYKRPSRRRRNQSGQNGVPPNLQPAQQQGVSSTSPSIKVEGRSPTFSNGHGSTDHNGAHQAIREGMPQDSLNTAWRSFAMASQSTIDRLMDVYSDVIYPLFPFFHGPTLRNRLHNQEYLTDRGFFASIMAACALAAARARDGAVEGRYHFDENLAGITEMFFSAAQDTIPKDVSTAHGLGYLRACALLAISSIQYGQITAMHQYIGHYHTLSAMQRFHDESQWPELITAIEKEERRRLFWGMYSWDVYTSIVFNTILKSQESFSNVRYPIEASDDELFSGIESQTNDQNWLRGWNFTTDLYRVLEHTVGRLRRNNQARGDRVDIARLTVHDGISETQVVQNIHNLYNELPDRFKEYSRAATGDMSHDIFGFQAANIQATLQLVRIALCECSPQSDLWRKCDVVDQVITAFASMHSHYLRAISTPLVYHLGAIGQILATLMHGELNFESYERVRGSLEQLANLLEGLETSLQPTAGASKGIRARIQIIDQFMSGQRRELEAFHGGQQNMGDLAGGIGVNGTSQYPNGTSSGQPPLLKSTNSLGMHTPLDAFQLPHDVLGEFPFPFDFQQDQATNGSQAIHQSNGHGQDR